jgi:uncharacterized protein with HEPN domain
MSRSDKVYLDDILEAIEIIQIYTLGKTETEFVNDVMLQDAVIRRFEIIGEAATKVSDVFKKANSTIQWRLMAEMRNKLIHEYFGVSAVTIYSTVQADLPILRQQIETLLNSY